MACRVLVSSYYLRESKWNVVVLFNCPHLYYSKRFLVQCYTITLSFKGHLLFKVKTAHKRVQPPDLNPLVRQLNYLNFNLKLQEDIKNNFLSICPRFSTLGLISTFRWKIYRRPSEVLDCSKTTFSTSLITLFS